MPLYAFASVVTHRRAPCRSQQTVALTRKTGAIANVVTMETGCGAPRSPWLIEGLPGQRINLTLVDFSHGVPHVVNAKCYAYAIVRVSRNTETIIRGNTFFTRLSCAPRRCPTGGQHRVVVPGDGPVCRRHGAAWPRRTHTSFLHNTASVSRRGTIPRRCPAGGRTCV